MHDIEVFLQWNTKVFSSKSSWPPTFWILTKTYDLYESSWKNPIETLQQKSFEHWTPVYVWICYFAPVISQWCIKHTLVQISKLLPYLFPSKSFSDALLRFFSRFLQVAVATWNFVNKVYNGGFAPEFNVSMLKGISVYKTYICNGDKKSFSSETLKLFFRTFLASYILDHGKLILWVLPISLQISSWNFRIRELKAYLDKKKIFLNCLNLKIFIIFPDTFSL